MNYNDYLKLSSDEFKKNLDLANSDFAIEITDMIIKLEVLNNFLDLFKEQDSCKVLNEVNYDLFSSIYLALNGMYRNAFISLRSASELILGFLYFTDYNYHYELWKKMNYDLKWSLLSDHENGILSKSYLHNYATFSSAENLIADYHSVYRYCSEFVHGKYEYMHTLKSSTIAYDRATFKLFCEKYNLLTDLLFSLLIIRFGKVVRSFTQENYSFLMDYSKRYSLDSLLPEYGK